MSDDAAKKTNNVSLVMSDAELASLDDWRFSRRIGSRAEAIRRLLELGLAADAAGWSPEAPTAKKASKKSPAKKGQA